MPVHLNNVQVINAPAAWVLTVFQQSCARHIYASMTQEREKEIEPLDLPKGTSTSRKSQVTDTRHGALGRVAGCVLDLLAESAVPP